MKFPLVQFKRWRGLLNRIKEQLKKYYNDNVQERELSKKQAWKINLRDRFLNSMKGKEFVSLLEIGAGTGQDSLFFSENDLDVMAIDLSEKHIQKCKDKKIEAYVMDFTDMDFDNDKFDCLYAMNTLLHISNDDIYQTLMELKRVVKRNGYLYLCQYGGIDNLDEGIKTKDERGSRFFSFRTYEYFKDIVEKASFEIIDSGKIDIGNSEHCSQFFILKST